MALMIICPICGAREGCEFSFGGEEPSPRPRNKEMSLHEWCDYVYLRDNVRGLRKEWWYHREGCGLWFTLLRNTGTGLETEA